jgi:hypothetical protein
MRLELVVVGCRRRQRRAQRRGAADCAVVEITLGDARRTARLVAYVHELVRDERAAVTAHVRGSK